MIYVSYKYSCYDLCIIKKYSCYDLCNQKKQQYSTSYVVNVLILQLNVKKT